MFDIDSLYNTAKSIPFLKGFINKYDSQINLAKTAYKSMGFTGSPTDIEKGFKAVEDELKESRSSLAKSLQPFLNHPFLRGAVNLIAPGSADHFKNIVDQANSSTSAQSNGNSSGDSGIASRYPKKFNF